MVGISMHILQTIAVRIAKIVLISLSFSSLAAASLDSRLDPKNVAVIVNSQDANSVEIGQYYLQARGIPEQNLVRIDMPKNQSSLTEKEFNTLKQEIEGKLGTDIKVLALIWTRPYAVGCNSITAAMTLGYDAEQCKRSCDIGKKNPYFNSLSFDPWEDHKIRLSILIPSDSIKTAKDLIDRGVLTGFNLNPSTGYFLRTSDEARSKPREPFFPKDFFKVESRKIVFRNIKQNDIQHKNDVMFYFTGLIRVPHLETLNFMPGAIADHLTSSGGRLDSNSKGQMSVIAWIEAGATGSYGTVSEPCNHWQKFPNPELLVKYYLAGNTLIEAYWKSVYWPAQGLFVGEPLAAPFKGIH